MLPTVLVGAVLGVMWGVFSQRQGPEDDNQQEGSTEQVQQQHEQAPLPLQDNSAQHQPRKSSRFSNYRLATALGGLVCLAAAATVSMIVAHRRRHGRKKQHRCGAQNKSTPYCYAIYYRSWITVLLEGLARPQPIPTTHAGEDEDFFVTLVASLVPGQAAVHITRLYHMGVTGCAPEACSRALECLVPPSFPAHAQTRPTHHMQLSSFTPCIDHAGIDHRLLCIACVFRHTDGRIPLKDLIRFKERQWFVEELEVRGPHSSTAMWGRADWFFTE